MTEEVFSELDHKLLFYMSSLNVRNSLEKQFYNYPYIFRKLNLAELVRLFG